MSLQGHLELDAVDKELVVSDGGRIVGHGGAMRRSEMMEGSRVEEETTEG